MEQRGWRAQEVGSGYFREKVECVRNVKQSFKACADALIIDNCH